MGRDLPALLRPCDKVVVDAHASRWGAEPRTVGPFKGQGQGSSARPLRLPRPAETEGPK